MTQTRKKRQDEESLELKRGIAERFQQILEQKGETPSSLAKALDKGSTNFYVLSDPEKPNIPNIRLIVEIVEHFPELSMDWLIRGVGSPWETGSSSLAIKEFFKFDLMLNELSEMIEEKHTNKWIEHRASLMETYIYFIGEIKSHRSQNATVEELKTYIYKEFKK